MSHANSPSGLSLFAVLLGCKPKGRNVEQHDVFFGVANKLDDLSDTIKGFWYKTIIAELTVAIKKENVETDTSSLEKNLTDSLSRRDKIHIDAWIRVEHVDNYKIVIRPKTETVVENNLKLYFINLGGYKENEFEEFHKKKFVVATSVSDALGKIMNHPFMKEYSPDSLGLPGSAHLDDQYKIDFEADDVVCISEVIGTNYLIDLEPVESLVENKMVVGYTHINYPE